METTINDRLDRINYIQQSILDNSKICESLLKIQDDPIHKAINQESYTEEIISLIRTIVSEIDQFKAEQLEILSINFDHELDYNGKTYKIIELIKLKETYKLKLDNLLSYSKILDKIPNDIIQLEVQILIANFRKEYQNLNRVLNNFNTRTYI